MARPRWKGWSEIAFGLLWIVLSTMVANAHELDPAPWPILWFALALINALWAMRIIARAWKEL